MVIIVSQSLNGRLLPSVVPVLTYFCVRTLHVLKMGTKSRKVGLIFFVCVFLKENYYYAHESWQEIRFVDSFVP